MQAGIPSPFSMPVPDNAGASRPHSGLREFPEDGGAFDALLLRSLDPVTGGGTPAETGVPTTPQTGGPGRMTEMPGIPPADGGGTPAELGGTPVTGGGGRFAAGTLIPQTGGETPPDIAVPQPRTGGGTPAETAQPLIPQTGGGTPADTVVPNPASGGGKGGEISAAPGTLDDPADLAALTVKAGGAKSGTPVQAAAAQTPTGTSAAATPASAQTGTPAPAITQDSGAPVQPVLAASASAAGQAQQAAAQSGTDAATLAAVKPQGETALRPLRQGSEQRVISDAAFNSNSSSAARAGSASLTAPPVQTGQTGQTAGQSLPNSPTAMPDMASAAKAAPLPSAAAPVLPNTGNAPLQVMADAAPDSVQGQETLQRSADVQSSERPAAQAAAARMTPQSPQHLAAQIARRFNGGGRQFDIRMDPAELGRVDVRLQVGNDNRVHAILSAERPETLAELQRTARELERALADAGLELGESGLEFQLSQGDADRESGTPGHADFGVYAEADGATIEVVPAEAAQRLYGFALSERSGVDVRI